MHFSRIAPLAAAAGVLASLAVLTPQAANAQINIGGANPLTYSQNFDSLATTGTTNTFTDNGTITGLYSNRVVYLASTGSNNAGGLYSFGPTSTPERALGSIASGTVDPVLYGFRFVNTGATSLTNLQVAYTGETWRLGNNTATHSLIFEYAIFAANAGAIGTGAYTNISALNYSATGTGTTTSGDTAPIQTAAISNGAGTAITLNAGQELWIRWRDVDDAGVDHGIAVDGLNVTFSATTAVPEPGTLALLGIGLLPLGVVAVRRRNKR